VLAGRGRKLEMGRRRVVGPGFVAAGRGEKPHPLRGELQGRGQLQRRVAAGSMRAGDWVGLVGDAEWPARNRSEDRPLHAERIRCS